MPAEEDAGLIFVRSDLSGSPEIPAHLDQVVSTPRCTILGNGKATIHTVEHILAALHGLGIDNAKLVLDGPEVPILDGSAAPFIDAILDAGIESQEKPREVYALKKPLSWSKGDVHLIALPADQFRISYTLHYPKSTLLRSQFHSSEVGPQSFTHEIASSRTFCLYEEIAPLIEQGMIKGGGLENAVIIKEDRVVNEEGVRFEDEMVRHKVLDLIGDFSLIPFGVTAHIVAIRSGHASNIAFAKELAKQIKMENS